MRKFLIPLFALLLIVAFGVDAQAGPIRRAGKGVARAGKIAAKIVTAPFRLFGGCGCE